MKPAAFEYHRPGSVEEALRLLAELGDDATLIAGGQSLVPMMNLRLAQPAHLIDLNAVAGLQYVREHDGRIEVGAMTRHHTVASSELVRERCPLLAEAAATIGHYVIRQRGTIGGSLVQADPAAQCPLVAVSLGARVRLRGPQGEREVDAADFFLAMMTTAIEPGEILVAASFPSVVAGEGQAFAYFNRRHGDYALVAAACSAVVSDARVRALRLGVGGATPVAQALPQVAQAIVGRASVAQTAREAGALAREAIEPMETPGVDAEYRSELVAVMVERAVHAAMQRAGATKGS